MSSTNAQIVTIHPSAQLTGAFYLPGDKSISHRSAMFAALGDGVSQLLNYSSARDCQSTLACLAALGVKIEREPNRIIVHGVGREGLRASSRMPKIILDAGNSGTTIRLLSGILAGQPFATSITGDESIQRRPMRRIIEPLTQMGARITARDNNFAPLTIHGGNLKAMTYQPPIASAQVKSCTLLAGLFADGTTTVIETTPTRNHTEVMLHECGVALAQQDERISLVGGQRLKPLGEYTVAGDLSSAAFFLVAALLAPEAEITLRHIGINPSRTALLDVLRAMGGRIEITNQRLAHGEPVADLVAAHSQLKGDHTLSGAVIANLIDEIPILAVAATQLDGTLTIREAKELRVKESDRIHAIVTNLRALGVTVEEFEDGFTITGRQSLKGACVESFGDHRIAMAFAVAGLIATGATAIANAEAASVSLPEFYQLLAHCGATVSA